MTVIAAASRPLWLWTKFAWVENLELSHPGGMMAGMVMLVTFLTAVVIMMEFRKAVW